MRERLFVSKEGWWYHRKPYPAIVFAYNFKVDPIHSTLLQVANPTYEGLLEENRRLKAELAGRKRGTSGSDDSGYGEVLNITERFERDLFDVVNDTTRTSTVSTDDQVLWPSESCVKNLLSYGRTWTSWIHCALHHPTFELECRAVFDETDGSVAAVGDSLWLAVFFSFLSVSDLTVIAFICS